MNISKIDHMASPYRFIIAEHTPSWAFVIQRLILRRYPEAVVNTYAHAREALEEYEQSGADVIVVNHRMPHMSGPELAHTLRARGDCVPILGISDDPYVGDEFMAMGATAFLHGHDCIDGLLSCIEQLLRDSQERPINGS